jgi:hydroxylamine dehydrogenase
MYQMKILRKIVLLLVCVFFFLAVEAGAFYVDPKNIGSPAGEICVQCHRETTPGIYNQWRNSAMGQANVNCYDCHGAEKTDIDAFDHKESIAIVVTPKDCSKCHEKEYKEFTSSHHASAVETLNSFDNLFGRVVWGAHDDKTGCIPCHGSTLKVLKDGMLSPKTWPNTGIGRINPDKSKGSCSACHARHIFSREQARRPATCGRCHSGPDDSMDQVYGESKHGVMYEAFRDDMNMDKRRWLAGTDYWQGPTCASCHMSAIPPQLEVKNADERLEQALRSVLSGGDKEFESLLPPAKTTKSYHGATHDVGARLSWNLRTSVSKKQDKWQEKRQYMQSVCMQCHGEHFVKQAYTQFDRVVDTYNKKFGIPATNIRQALMAKGKLTKKDYDEKLDTIYWKLWQVDGIKARYGAAMMGEGYAWSKGLQPAAERYYMEFIPEVRRILGGSADRFLNKHGYKNSDYK